MMADSYQVSGNNGADAEQPQPEETSSDTVATLSQKDSPIAEGAPSASPPAAAAESLRQQRQQQQSPEPEFIRFMSIVKRLTASNAADARVAIQEQEQHHAAILAAAAKPLMNDLRLRKAAAIAAAAAAVGGSGSNFALAAAELDPDDIMEKLMATGGLQAQQEDDASSACLAGPDPPLGMEENPLKRPPHRVSETGGSNQHPRKKLALVGNVDPAAGEDPVSVSVPIVIGQGLPPPGPKPMVTPPCLPAPPTPRKAPAAPTGKSKRSQQGGQKHLQLVTDYLLGPGDAPDFEKPVTLRPMQLQQLRAAIRERLISVSNVSDESGGCESELREQLKAEKNRVSDLSMGLANMIQEYEKLREHANVSGVCFPEQIKEHQRLLQIKEGHGISDEDLRKQLHVEKKKVSDLSMGMAKLIEEHEELKARLKLENVAGGTGGGASVGRGRKGRASSSPPVPVQVVGASSLESESIASSLSEDRMQRKLAAERQRVNDLTFALTKLLRENDELREQRKASEEKCI